MASGKPGAVQYVSTKPSDVRSFVKHVCPDLGNELTITFIIAFALIVNK
jgi:hypothetical protein